MQIRDLRPLTMLVAGMVAIGALWTPLVLGTALLAPAAFAAHVTPIAQSVDLAQTLFKLLTTILFAIWIYQAGQNLRAAGFDDLQFTPGARIWWFAVPVANLFKPFEGMRELWNASHERYPYSESGLLVSLWWACYLLVSFARSFMRLFAGIKGSATGELWLASPIEIALAITAILLIWNIAKAQLGLRGDRLEAVFA
ncbi:DUF4328 domain-containing protein [Sphingomonas sp. RB3P16]|uniref:DUF4328 domain-containing protein n=1 Tax=Parasphingomonas frigoris TaxID=3096163 RepID=UPI002FC9FD1E